MTNSARGRRKSLSFQRTNSDEGGSLDMSDSDVSSQSKSTRNSRRTSPKKLKRAATSEIKQSINWRCDPQKIRAFMKDLTPEQLKWIEELGFGSLIEMIDCKLPRKLTIWLMSKVHCDSKSLVFRNRKVSILEAVENLLKLPALDKEVPMPRPGRVRDKPFRGKTEFKAATAGRGESLNEVTTRMLTYKQEEDKDNFCICFMQVILCAYLAPTTGYQINRSYLLGALKDLSDIPPMNWCRFAADYLIEGIRESRQNKVHNLNVAGCIHILHLIYVDLLKSNLVSIPQGYPRLKYVGSEVLNQIDPTGKKKTKDHCQMFENFLDDEKLARFPLAEEPVEDLNDTENSTHSTPTVRVQLTSSPCQDKQTVPPKLLQTSRKRQADNSTDETLIKRIKKLEEHYRAERQKWSTFFERKLHKKHQELEVQKTKEIAALVQQQIDKALFPMIDNAAAPSSHHNDDPVLNKGSIGTESPSHSNVDNTFLLSVKSAEFDHQTSSHVDAIPQMTGRITSSQRFMDATATHESEPASNMVFTVGGKDENFLPASSSADEITQYDHSVPRPSIGQDFTPTDHIVQSELDRSKDDFVQRICNSENLQSEKQAPSAVCVNFTEYTEENAPANVVPASNISSVPNEPSPSIITNNAGQQDQSQPGETLRNSMSNEMSNEDSSMMKIVASEVQPDISSVVPSNTNINDPANPNTVNQAVSNACALEHANRESSSIVLHEVPSQLTTVEIGYVIKETAMIPATSTQPASQELVDTPSDIPASDVIQKPLAEQLENLHLTKNDIQSKNDIETAHTDATSKQVQIISSPPLSLEIACDVSIMSVSQMSREYDNMKVLENITIHTKEHTGASPVPEEVIQPQPSTSGSDVLQKDHSYLPADIPKPSSEPEAITLLHNLVEADHSNSGLTLLQIDHSNLPAAQSKPTTEPSPFTLPIAQSSPMECQEMAQSDKEELDKCVEMILFMSSDMPSNMNENQETAAHGNENNLALSHHIKEVLTENIEQSFALAAMHTQCTAGDVESSSSLSTHEVFADPSQIDITGQKEHESEDHPSDNSSEAVSSERTCRCTRVGVP
ncbi:uncharacterized protein [Triticum aestivum]|nr:uncharacterized protein LOC123072520 isoform X2 [Triticum aestivum]